MQTALANDAPLQSHQDPSTSASTPSLRTARVLEIDTFCTNCHYNLHAQIVTIDERLGFPICRCPECGTFHPAGVGVTASTLWVRRIASILLYVWTGIVVAGFIGIGAVMFPLQFSSAEAFTYFSQTSSTFNRYGYVELLHDWTNPGTPETNGYVTMICISLGSLFAGFVAGTLCVTLMWHWPKVRYLWTLVVPLIPAMILVQIYRSMPEYHVIYIQCIEHVFSQMAIQCAGICIGVLVGRKVSRLLFRMVIPPKPRQALAFLWTVDGLKPA